MERATVPTRCFRMQDIAGNQINAMNARIGIQQGPCHMNDI